MRMIKTRCLEQRHWLITPSHRHSFQRSDVLIKSLYVDCEGCTELQKGLVWVIESGLHCFVVMEAVLS